MNEENLTYKQKIEYVLNGESPGGVLYNHIFLSLTLLVFSLFIMEISSSGLFFVRGTEILFGIIILIEYIVRLWVTPNKVKTAFNPLGLLDIIVIISLLGPIFVGNLAILRVVRSFKVSWDAKQTTRVSKEITFIERNKDFWVGLINFITFLFVMTITVFVSQMPVNDQINTYFDAFYFTVTTLTTTGFGDITPVGQGGRMISVLIMILGITLSVRLVKTIFKKRKVLYTCPDCGLKTHDLDAYHCKHCGRVIKNEEELEDSIL